MRRSVATNLIFFLKLVCDNPKELFFTMGDTHILLSYTLVSSWMIKDIEKWNNGKIDMFWGGVLLIVLLGLVNYEYMTNESNYFGIYCTKLNTSVGFLIWCTLINSTHIFHFNSKCSLLKLLYTLTILC